MVENRVWIFLMSATIYLLSSLFGLLAPSIVAASSPEPDPGIFGVAGVSGIETGFLEHKSIPAVELAGWIQSVETSVCQQGRFALMAPGQVLPIAYLDGISEDLDVYLQLHVQVTGFRTYYLEQCPPFVRVMWVKILP
ncbi:MAG: hypothetical protein EXR62_03205 [Chloroflexi bacterium]|nr:hypothetical protein [Chloroflexota bacterium]